MALIPLPDCHYQVLIFYGMVQEQIIAGKITPIPAAILLRYQRAIRLKAGTVFIYTVPVYFIILHKVKWMTT
jgi:hypothetical protein